MLLIELFLMAITLLPPRAEVELKTAFTRSDGNAAIACRLVVFDGTGIVFADLTVVLGLPNRCTSPTVLAFEIPVTVGSIVSTWTLPCGFQIGYIPLEIFSCTFAIPLYFRL